MTNSNPEKHEYLSKALLAIGSKAITVLKDPDVQAGCVIFATNCRAALGPAKEVVRSGAGLASELARAWRRQGRVNEAGV